MSRTYQITLEASVEQVGDDLEIESVEIDGQWVKQHGKIYKPGHWRSDRNPIENAIVEAAFKQAEADDWSDEKRRRAHG